MLDDADLLSLLLSRRPGTSLPRAFYCSPEAHDAGSRDAPPPSCGRCREQDEPFESWTGYRERDVYCCGPEPFMRETLQSLGFDMVRYHQGSFAAPVERADDPPPPDVAPDPASLAELIFTRSGRTITCAQTDTVRQITKEAGLNLPSG